MIIENNLKITFQNLYHSELKPYAEILHSFTFSCEANKEDEFSVSGLNFETTSFVVNEQVLRPLSENESSQGSLYTCRYALSLDAGRNTAELCHRLPLRTRKGSSLFLKKYRTLYTLHYSFIDFKRFGIAEETASSISAEAKLSPSIGARLLCGAPVLLFGSKSRDEEQGIAHKTRTFRTGGRYRAELRIPYSLPDQIALTVGMKKALT